MEPSMRKVFLLSNVFKFLPFRLEGDCLQIYGYSWQTFFFGLQCLGALLFALFILFSTIMTFVTDGPVLGISFAAWLVAQGFTVVIYFTLIAKCQSLKESLLLIAQKWKLFSHDKRFWINEQANALFLLWTFLAFLWPEVTVLALNYTEPHMKIFFSGFVCAQFYTPDTCPDYVLFLSMLAQFCGLAVFFMSTVIMDLLPMFCAMLYTRIFKVLAEDMHEHLNKGCIVKPATVARRLVSVGNKVLPVVPLDTEGGITGEENTNSRRGFYLRSFMQDHMDIQACLMQHNDAFGPFMLVSVVQIFFLSLVLLYAVVQVTGVNSDMETLVFLGNGTQFLIRGTVLMKVYAATKEAISEARKVLILKGGLINGQWAKEDPSLSSDVLIFITSLDGMSVTAGPFFSFTYGFMLSFYSILATYLAILIQST